MRYNLANLSSQTFRLDLAHCVLGKYPTVCIGGFDMGLSIVFKTPAVAFLSILMIASEAGLVKAGPCQSYEAAYTLESLMREGF